MGRHGGGPGGTSRKYHSPKRGIRSLSHYPERLAARDLGKTPAMRGLESLRRRQATDEWLAAHPAIRDNLAGVRDNDSAAVPPTELPLDIVRV